ncbi:MAG TPA: hypothetical protein VFI41_04515 [Gemmatimonadales bacterium]|nr:hypothetical protein [Gemmatimonadales bacterium]
MRVQRSGPAVYRSVEAALAGESVVAVVAVAVGKAAAVVNSV